MRTFSLAFAFLKLDSVPAVPTRPLPSRRETVFKRDDRSTGLGGGDESSDGFLNYFLCLLSCSEKPRVPVSLHGCNCYTISASPLTFPSPLLPPESPATHGLTFPSSHQAVPGGAAQCHRAQRCGTAGHLHSQRGKRRNLRLQGHWRQHRPPGGIRVRRPITGGRNGALCVKGSGSQQQERNTLPHVLQGKVQYRNSLMFDFSQSAGNHAFIPRRRPHSLPLSRFPGF